MIKILNNPCSPYCRVIFLKIKTHFLLGTSQGRPPPDHSAQSNRSGKKFPFLLAESLYLTTGVTSSRIRCVTPVVKADSAQTFFHYMIWLCEQNCWSKLCFQSRETFILKLLRYFINRCTHHNSHTQTHRQMHMSITINPVQQNYRGWMTTCCTIERYLLVKFWQLIYGLLEGSVLHVVHGDSFNIVLTCTSINSKNFPLLLMALAWGVYLTPNPSPTLP